MRTTRGNEEQAEMHAQAGGFTQRLSALSQNMTGRGQEGADSSELISLLMGELKLALEMLTVQDRVISNLQQELVAARSESERERKRNDELINYNPVSCLVTDTSGKILQVNREAATLLNANEKMLVDKYLVLFIDEADRRDFNTQLQNRFRVSRRMIYKTRLQPHESKPMDVTFTVSTVDGSTGQPSSLLWMMETAKGDGSTS